jgi:hypothetical protein
MKKYIILLALCLPIVSMANQKCEVFTEEAKVEEQLEIKTDVPNFLKGATIIVRLANGKESVVSADKFKVVPRKQQFITIRVKETNVHLCSIEQEQQKQIEKEKNRISLLGGQGPDNKLSVSRDATSITVESKTKPIAGVQYQRLITDKISVGAQVQTNESALLSIGLDF